MRNAEKLRKAAAALRGFWLDAAGTGDAVGGAARGRDEQGGRTRSSKTRRTRCVCRLLPVLLPRAPPRRLVPPPLMLTRVVAPSQYGLRRAMRGAKIEGALRYAKLYASDDKSVTIVAMLEVPPPSYACAGACAGAAAAIAACWC